MKNTLIALFALAFAACASDDLTKPNAARVESYKDGLLTISVVDYLGHWRPVKAVCLGRMTLFIKPGKRQLEPQHDPACTLPTELIGKAIQATMTDGVVHTMNYGKDGIALRINRPSPDVFQIEEYFTIVHR